MNKLLRIFSKKIKAKWYCINCRTVYNSCTGYSSASNNTGYDKCWKCGVNVTNTSFGFAAHTWISKYTIIDPRFYFIGKWELYGKESK